MRQVVIQRLTGLTEPIGRNEYIEWAWPQVTVAALRAGAPFVDNAYTVGTSTDRASLVGKDTDDTITEMLFSLNAEIDNDGDKNTIMIVPRDGQAEYDFNKPTGLKVAKRLFEMETVCRDWEVVCEVVEWCDKHCSLAAARQLFPGILTLLPRHHPIHAVVGTRTADPKIGAGSIIAKVRQAMGTVAMAQMCPENEISPWATVTRHNRPDLTGFYGSVPLIW